MTELKLLNKYKSKLLLKNKIFNCQIGLNGTAPIYKKIEGDYTTPRGKWKLGRIMLRKDKLHFLKIKKCIRRITTNIYYFSGWCDDFNSLNYNKYFEIKDNITVKNFSYEKLYRKDDVYDIIIEICYNIYPTIKRKGSAIFLHCSFNDKRSTKGCIAISKKNLIFILKNLKKNSHLKVC